MTTLPWAIGWPSQYAAPRATPSASWMDRSVLPAPPSPCSVVTSPRGMRWSANHSTGGGGSFGHCGGVIRGTGDGAETGSPIPPSPSSAPAGYSVGGCQSSCGGAGSGAYLRFRLSISVRLSIFSAFQKLQKESRVFRVIGKPCVETRDIILADDVPKRVDGRLRCVILPADSRGYW